MRGGIAQLNPMLHRQGDGARFASVLRVTMKIGSTSCEQVQPGCHVAVPIDRLRVVIRVKELDRVKPGFHVCGNTGIDVRLSGMSHRHETARRMHDVDHLAGRRTAARNERRTTGCQPAIKGLARVNDIPGGDHRPRDLRPPHGTSALFAGLHHYRCNVDRHPELRQPRAERFDACDPLATLLREERRQFGIAWIDEVPEQVYVAAIFDRRDFDTRNDLDAARLRRRLNLRYRRDRVVVGHRHHGNAGAQRTVHQFVRRAAAVRRGGVEMEIDDHRADARCEADDP